MTAKPRPWPSRADVMPSLPRPIMSIGIVVRLSTYTDLDNSTAVTAVSLC